MSDAAATNPHPLNRLAHESSPYLLQHARNPVDWWPWGPQAIDEARRRDVPIFLSVGYSTCYWCHVMERESFENAEIAEQLNRDYVSIKLDREERPDLDDLYMIAVQMLTGHGGWPMSVFLDPQTLRPFWGGTYFPPRPARGMPGFPQVLESMARAYRDQRAEVQRQGEQIASAVAERVGRGRSRPVAVGPEQVAMAVESLLTTFDAHDGGFGRAPKFPQPAYLEFLLAARDAVDPNTRAAIDSALRLTLDRMATGGIFDQVGGGFHRYSVDAHWLVPHFEKMLYDQAQLLGVYATACVVYRDSFYGLIARRTADYVLRELALPDGGFSSAQDAEVDGKEGDNYLWTLQEVAAALPAGDRELALRVYGLDAGPNFRDPHHPDSPSRNVLRLEGRPEVIAPRVGLQESALLESLQRINASLYAVRAARRQPRLDDKAIVSWNAMMAAGLVKTGHVLNEPRYTGAAVRAVEFIERLRSPEGLLRVSRQGRAHIPAMLEDIAALASAYTELHAAGVPHSGSESWLDKARRVVENDGGPFSDGAGGYFDVREGTSDLFVRARSTYDGAMPSASSVMLNVLVEIAAASGDRQDRRRALEALASLSGVIAESPLAAVNSSRGLLGLLRLDGEALASELAAMGAEPGLSDQPVVEVMASTDRVEVGPDAPAELLLRLDIPDGYHINAADAANESSGSLVPLHVGIAGGTGVAAYCDYPLGEQFEGAKHRVHHGRIELRVALEATDQLSGRPRLVVSYQLCSQHACLAPRAVTLDVELMRLR